MIRENLTGEKEMENKAVVICSGGLDSTTLLYYTMKRRHVIPLVISFNYGQAHKKELNCIKSMCKKLKLEHMNTLLVLQTSKVASLKFLRSL